MAYQENDLGLSGWVMRLWGEPMEHEYRLPARYAVGPEACPECGTHRPRLHVHGSKVQPFRDVEIHHKRVTLLVDRPRWKCLECGGTFQQELPQMDERRFMTKRLVERIAKESLRRTFSDVAEEAGVNEKTVREIFREYAAALEGTQRQFLTPRQMGIDEVKLSGRPRCIITNLGEHTIYDLLEARDQEVVTEYLRRLRDPGHVELVAMDMWGAYRRAVRAALPRARIVVDRFHVERMATQALDAMRARIRDGLAPAERRRFAPARRLLTARPGNLDALDRQKLNRVLAEHPRLRMAYDAKERFYAIYDEASTRAAADARLISWCASVESEIADGFAKLLRAIANWREEMLAYFECRVTNAFTEAQNGLVKLLNRQGRGYGFQAIRAKALFSGSHVVRRPRLTPFGDIAMAGFMSRAGMDCFGVSIAELLAHGLPGAPNAPTHQSE